jgi:hypothetical protein
MRKRRQNEKKEKNKPKEIKYQTFCKNKTGNANQNINNNLLDQTELSIITENREIVERKPRDIHLKCKQDYEALENKVKFFFTKVRLQI